MYGSDSYRSSRATTTTTTAVELYTGYHDEYGLFFKNSIACLKKNQSTPRPSCLFHCFVDDSRGNYENVWMYCNVVSVVRTYVWS